MLKKLARAQILSAHTAADAAARDGGLARTAHRADFSHHPVRPGYLYVRSRAISSRCNDNFDEFPAQELEKSWRTFVGKPVFVNHVNGDTDRARGVCIDAALHRDHNPDGTPDTWVEVLMEVDGVNFPKLAEAILAKRVYETSMGCDVDYSICSACGNKATRPEEYCRHIPGSKGTLYATTDHKTGTRQTSPIREICFGLRFFENSLLVEPPADPTAQLLGIDATGLGKISANRRVCTDCGKRSAMRDEDVCKYCDAKQYAHWYGQQYLEGQNLHRMDWHPHLPGNIKPNTHNGEPSVHNGKDSLVWNGVCRDCGAETSVGLGGSSSSNPGAPVARDVVCEANDPAVAASRQDFVRKNHKTMIDARNDQISRGIGDAVTEYGHATEDALRRDIHDGTGLDTKPYTPPQRGTQHLNFATGYGEHTAATTARYTDTGPQCSRCHHEAGTGPGCPKCDATRELKNLRDDCDFGGDGHDMAWQYRDTGPTLHGACRNCERTSELGASGMRGDRTDLPPAHTAPCPAIPDRRPDMAGMFSHTTDYLPDRPGLPPHLNTRTAGYDPYGEWDGHGDPDDEDSDEEQQERAHARDWDDIHENMGGIHRGIGVFLHPEDHAVVHDKTRPVADRVHHLLNALPRSLHGRSWSEGSLGTHWTTEPYVAEDFAEKATNGPSQGRPGTAVVFHGHKPDRGDIDEHPNYMAGDIYGYHDHGEREIPLHGGTGVSLKGISFRNTAEVDDGDGGWEEADPDYTHHEFGGHGHHVHARTLSPRTAAFTDDHPGPDDGYVTCDHGHRHWDPARTGGAAGMLIHHNGRVLLGRRALHTDYGGTWGIPAGALEPGETPAQGAHREATEELGTLPQLRPTGTHRDDHGNWAFHTHIAAADHPFHPQGGDGETDEFRWVHPRDFGSYDLHPGFAASWPHLAPHVRGEGSAHTAAADDASYRFHHTAPGPEEVPLHRLLHPSQVRTLRSFENGRPADEETGKAISAADGRPRARIKIYRAVPAGVTTFTPGDWVGLSSHFARDFAEGRPNHHVITTTAEARHIHTDGNDALEWGYNGPAKEGKIHWRRPPRNGAPDYAGGAVQLSAEDHDFVHGTAPVADRAHRLMQAIPRWSKDGGPYSTGSGHQNRGSYTGNRSHAHFDAQDNADNLPDADRPPTLFMLHAPERSRAISGISFAKHTPPETPMSAYTSHTWNPAEVDEDTGMRHTASKAWWKAYGSGNARVVEAASANCSHCGEPCHGGYCTMGRVRTTDWSKVPHFDEIHRGFPVHLGAEDHAAVHDQERSPAERGAHLLAVLRDHSDSLGSHWSTDQHFAHDTAQEGWGHDLSSGYEDDEQPDDTHVVIHARFPSRHHIETDPDALHDGHVFGWNHRTPGDYPAEHEVPLKYGAPVHVTGISYKHPDDNQWTRAHFGDDMTHTAALQLQAMPPRHTNPADHPFFQEHPVSSAHVVAHWADATPEEKNQGQRWYSDAHLLAHALAHTYANGDTGKAAGVISAYSPRTSWAANMHNAARSLASGRALDVGEGLSIMGVHHSLAHKIMNGEDYDKVLKGPKTNAFAKLIHHGGIDPVTGTPMPHVVIDRHALSVAAGQRLSEEDSKGFPSSTPHYYNHVAKTYQDAADAISKAEGRPVAPHQVQATTWLVRIRHNQAEDRELRGGGGKGRVKNQENQLGQWRDLHPNLLPGGAGPDNMHMSHLTGARRRVEAMGDGSYRMMHQAPDEKSGEPLHEVLQEHPDELHTVYRAVPRHIHEINKGDWVTSHAEYAHQHALELEPGRRHGHVLQAQVPLRHLVTDHNDQNEIGYTGPDLHNVDTHEHPDFPETMHSDEDEEETEEPPHYAGGAVHLSGEDHAFVHNPAHPVAERAHRLMHALPNQYDAPYSALGHSTGYWDEDSDMAAIDAEERADKLGNTGAHHPATQFVLHSAEGDDRTTGVSWAEHGPDKLFDYDFTHHTWPASEVNDSETGLRKRASDDGDYKMQHTAPDASGAPLHDPSRPIEPDGMAFPDDVHEHPEWYTGFPDDHEMMHSFRRARGNPDAKIRFYRAVPQGVQHISTGDWVTLSKEYAKLHAQDLEGTGRHGHVLQAHAPAHQLTTDGNDLQEWAYHGPQKIGMSSWRPKGYKHKYPGDTDPNPDKEAKLAYGETKAPAQVDTLRDDQCMVCGNQEGWDGISCPVCQFTKPPDLFMDPDTSVARAMDLRGVGDDAAQTALQQGADEIPGGVDQADGQMPGGDPAQGQLPGGVAQGPGGEMEDPQDATADGEVRTLGDGDPAAQEAEGQTDAQAPGGEMSPAQMPPNAQDVLTCPACGFQTPAGPPVSTVTDDPSAPASAGPVAGDVCPNCGKAVLVSSAEEAGLTPPPEVPALDPQVMDAQAVPGQDGAPPQEEPAPEEEPEDDGGEEQEVPKAQSKPKSPAVKRVSRRDKGGTTRT